MSFETTQDGIIHHAANAAAITIPIISASLNGPLILTYSTAGLGAVWYVILIGERVNSWVQKWKARKK